MTEVLLFHHAQGLTPGVRAFADELRGAGHTVHIPDLYGGGETFPTVAEGVAHARGIGFGTILERGRAFAEDLPSEVVYAGMSLGVMPAQMLAQTRSGSKGALLCFGTLPPSEFGEAWPENVPAQIHMKEHDPEMLEGDLDEAHKLAGTVEHVELFLYPGEQHLFVDNSLPDYDKAAATVMTQRVLTFLDDVG